MLKKSLIIIATMAILLSLAGVAYSQNLFPSANQQARPGQSQDGFRQRRRPKRGGKKLGRLLRRTMRGTLFVKGRDGKTERLRIDRGKITSITDKLLTIKEMDGHIVRIDIDKDTKFAGKPLDQLQEGDPVGAVRHKKSGHYKTLVIMSKHEHRGQRPDRNRFGQSPNGQGDIRPPAQDEQLGI